jgi:hypothetical protein
VKGSYVEALGTYHESVHWSGVLTVDPDELDAALAGDDPAIREMIRDWGLVELHPDEGKILLLPKKNLVVNNGITRLQNLGWAIGGALQAMNCIGIDNGANNPAAGSTSLVSDAGPPTSVRIQAFDSAATQTT